MCVIFLTWIGLSICKNNRQILKTWPIASFWNKHLPPGLLKRSVNSCAHSISIRNVSDALQNISFGIVSIEVKLQSAASAESYDSYFGPVCANFVTFEDPFHKLELLLVRPQT